METGFPSGGTPTLAGAVTRHLLLFCSTLSRWIKEQMRVEVAGREGGRGGEGCIEEEKQVRHGYLVSALFSRRMQSDKRKKRQREEGSAAGKVICL